MDSFPFLALPPELRAKVYRCLLPTVSRPSAYLGLRLSCSTIQREYDYEALLRLRCVYRSVITSHPNLPYTFEPPSHFKNIRNLVLRTKNPNPRIFQDLLMYQVVPWGFHWLRGFTIIHEPNGLEEYDDLVINCVGYGIATNITWDHPCQPHHNRAKVGSVDDISMLKRITFIWGEDEYMERPVPDQAMPWLRTFRRRNYVSFMPFNIYDGIGENTGCEWRRCRSWEESRPELRLFFLMFIIFVILIVVTIICLLMSALLM
jgi:hypothetical protein